MQAKTSVELFGDTGMYPEDSVVDWLGAFACALRVFIIATPEAYGYRQGDQIPGEAKGTNEHRLVRCGVRFFFKRFPKSRGGTLFQSWLAPGSLNGFQHSVKAFHETASLRVLVSSLNMLIDQCSKQIWEGPVKMGVTVSGDLIKATAYAYPTCHESLLGLF